MKHFDLQCSTNNNLLSILSEQYGSDKGYTGDIRPHKSGWLYHSYTDIYDFFLHGIKNTALNVLECGIGTNNPNLTSSMGINGTPGASLRMWRDYFPNAQVFGIDIDPNIMFTEERIKTFVVDQTDSDSIKEFKQNIDVNFDFILDDGLHAYLPQLTLFENMIDRLNPGGIYIIEDCFNSYSNFIEYLKDKEYQYLAIHGDEKSGMHLYDSFILIKK